MSSAHIIDEQPLGSSRPADDSPATLGAALQMFFQHRSPILLLLLALLALVLRAQTGPITGADLLIPVITLLAWPFVEWLIHVHMLHYQPRRILGRKIDFLLPQTHRAHHRDPWNLDLVFIPPHIFPLVTPLIALELWLFLPTPLALTSFATIMLFALHYEWCHYLAHIRYCPNQRFYQRRVREHRQHHFLHERKWWGVSMGFGDRVFRTAPARESVSRSATTRTLGQELPGEKAYDLMGVQRPGS